MARPRKVNTDVMQTTEPVEVVKEEEIQIAESKPVEDVVPELEVEILTPKVQEVKENTPTPICDIAELSETDKQTIIESRIKAIIDQTQIPFIPAEVTFREPGTTSVPPMTAILDYDHRFVEEGWRFYQTNVKNPYVKDYINLLAKICGKPNRILPRIVRFNWE